jgi:hypothetical protein
VVLYDDISTKNQNNLGKYVLIGSDRWFTDKEQAKTVLRTLKTKGEAYGKNDNRGSGENM